MHTTYNGWKNKSTRLVGLWWDECPIYMGCSKNRNEAIDELAEQLENFFFDEYFPQKCGLITDLLQTSVFEIDWRELSEHWVDDAYEIHDTITH